MVYEPITKTFETRRRLIMKTCDEDEKYYINDEYTEHDYEALLGLLRVMQDLLQYEPSERVSAQQAASYIKWTDYRRDDLNKSSEGEEDSDERELAQRVSLL